MKKNLKKRNKKGFTLIELVVVIAILGILAAILIPVIGGFIDRANIARDQANARNLFNCTAMYLATGGTIANQTLAVIPSTLPEGTGNSAAAKIALLFGTIDGTARVTVTDGVVKAAQYGTTKQIYNGDGTFSTGS